jgi:hypothetical protein
MFATRLFAVALLRNTRPAFQTTYHHYLPRYQRSFSVSPASHAEHAPDGLAEFSVALQKTSIWKKLADHPDAIAAVQDFGRMLQKAGKCTRLWPFEQLGLHITHV